jgi:hypothetical protein
LTVVLGADRVVLTLHRAALANATDLAPTRIDDGADQVEVSLPLFIKRRQGALIVESTQAPTDPIRKIDRALVRAVVLARGWAKLLESGEVGSVKELAQRNSLCEHYTMRLAPLAYLAPDITSAILEGRQPRALSLAGLTARPLPMNWEEQRRVVAEIGSR